MLIKDGEPYCDVIHEKTATAGVTIDSVLLKDGGATLTDTLNMGTNVIKFNDVALYNTKASRLRVMNLAGNQYRDLDLRTLRFQYIYSTDNASVFRVNAETGHVKFQGRVASAWTTHAELEDDCWSIARGGNITMLDQKMMQFGTYTDAQRPAAGTAGRIIFNTDDGQLNIDDGTNWTLPDGTIT